MTGYDRVTAYGRTGAQARIRAHLRPKMGDPSYPVINPQTLTGLSPAFTELSPAFTDGRAQVGTDRRGIGMMKTAYIELHITRDARVPLYADDEDWDHGWQCIPLPPRPDEHGEWQIDQTYDSDHKTRWFRLRIDMLKGAV
jgi:hypothetical protein